MHRSANRALWKRASVITAACAALCAMSASVGAADFVLPKQYEIGGMKPSVKPGDDFNLYVNGGWVDSTEIPADKGSWGIGHEVAEATDKHVAELIESTAKNSAGNEDAQRVGAFYTAYMDETGIEAKGLSPLMPVLDKIAAVKDKKELAHLLGSSIRADVDPVNSTNFFTENVFGLWVSQGLHDPDHYQAYLLQGGLGLPDRDYYLAKDKRMATLREKYQQHIAAVMKLAGWKDADKRAAAVFKLETAIARAHATREESEDVAKADNTWAVKDFDTKAKGMDWSAFFDGAGLAGQQSINVWHPGAMKGEAALVGSTPLPVWKDYLAFHQINHFSGSLSSVYADERFNFYGKVLSGVPQQEPRWKRGVEHTNAALGDAVGKIYVAKYFSPEAKAHIQTIVSNLIHAFDQRIDGLSWMAPATKAEAKAKLKTLYVGVGYPEHWTDYAGLDIRADDALGNELRAEEHAYKHALAKFGKPVDRTEWAMVPQIVNAVNLPLQNALNFPAGILQAPFFDASAPDARNYGSIGAVIGHEISHSFDDQGAQFDSQGRLRNWWTKEDLEHFHKSSTALANQFSTYKPFPDLAVKGQQTLSENIADLAGLNAALDAYHASLKDPSQGSDQQFFIAFGESWRTKEREATLRRQIATDGHAPAQYRIETVRNLDAWYGAFDVQPGQSLYLKPEDRVRIW